MNKLTHGIIILTLLIASGTHAENPPQAERLPLAELQLFAQVFEQIRSSYVEEIDDKTLLENAIVGLLAELDPHSAFLKEESFQDLQEHTAGEFSGIGIEVGMEGGFVKVISPIDDTPASRAGIEPGDLIIKLNDQAVQGMTLDAAINMMRGEKGSKLAITVARENHDAPLYFELTREVIKILSVRHKTLETGFGYVRIAQFQESTGTDFSNSLTALLAENKPLKGVILDLRNNPGGLLAASVEVADAILDSGLIVYTQGRAPSSNNRYTANSGDLLGGIPLVTLINSGTASAAEIVAGAIQDNGRGVLMGTVSFGKGSVQNVLPLEDGRAIKLTTARYYTPSGRSIQAAGIKPDLEVKRAEIRELGSSIQLREANLSRHLATPGGDKKPRTRSVAANKIKDHQLYEALNLLKGLDILSK